MINAHWPEVLLTTIIIMQTSNLPLILDFEASGFGRGSYPIEVGLALADGSTYCSLIQPLPEWDHWCPEGERTHGITREKLQNHGKPVELVAEELNSLLHNNVVYTDGWGFDQTWLALLFHHADRFIRFRLEPLQKLLSEEQKQLWNHTRNHVTEQLNLSRHRASNDARILQLTYQHSLGNALSTV